MSFVARHSTRPAAVLALLAASLFSTSCGNRSEETAPPPATTSEPAPAVAVTDANIAAIVVAANTVDIRNGELASTKSGNDAVKAFARQMIADHTSVNQQATELVTRLGVTPEENATSQALVANADATRNELSGRNGAEFDRAYVDNEVAYHQAVLDMLDQTLIPGATNPELKALLESVRPAFAAHLDHAKRLQGDLAP
jgi:putative membrane protein